MLEVADITVSYGAFEALHGMSLRVPNGETVGLFGPNGHGKTTTLRAISGLLGTSSGSILYEGRSIRNMPADRVVELGIIHVLQGSHLFPEMTVMENLLLGAYLPAAWRRRSESLKRVFELFPGLQDRRRQRCSTLSGGERQMAALGRGLMGAARLLMLDEPFLGLAPKIRVEIMQTVKGIKQLGLSIVLVEQNVIYVTSMCDRAYLVEEGRVAAEGTAEEILHNEYIREAYMGVA